VGKRKEGEMGPLPLKLCPTMMTNGSSQWKGGPPPKMRWRMGWKPPTHVRLMFDLMVHVTMRIDGCQDDGIGMTKHVPMRIP
jgi:hypothetical protein